MFRVRLFHPAQPRLSLNNVLCSVGNNLIPPFNFPDINFPISPSPHLHSSPIEKYMSIYAAHLYDSVILYAKVGSGLGLRCLRQDIAH